MKLTFYSDKELEKVGFKSLGTDVLISKQTIIKRPETISIGSHILIDPFVYITVTMDIKDYIHIAPYVGIIGGKRSYCLMDDFTFLAQGCKLVCGGEDYTGLGLINPTVPEKYRVDIYGRIIFEKYSGLGTMVVVHPNITIGEGTIVGSMSLVTKSLEPWGIYIGIPAKRLKERRKDLILKYVKEIRRDENRIHS